MIVEETRTAVGYYTVLQTKSFACGVSTLPGILGGSMAVMQANPDGTIKKWPPVAKAFFRFGSNREERDNIHRYVVGLLDQIGDAPNEVEGGRLMLTAALEGVFTVAKARGFIKKYLIDTRHR